MSGSLIWAPRHLRRSSTSWALRTRSSCSTASTAGSPIATPERSANFCSHSLAEIRRLRRMSTTTDQELAFVGPLALAEMVRTRQVQPRELVELFLRRIEQINPRLNAFRTTFPEQALAE